MLLCYAKCCQLFWPNSKANFAVVVVNQKQNVIHKHFIDYFNLLFAFWSSEN